MTITISAADLAALSAGQPVEIQGPAVTPPKPNPLSISGFSPTTGAVGSQFTITGSGFTGATAVKIGLIDFPPTNVVSDSQIIATVPKNAVTGNVAVGVGTAWAFDNSIFTVSGAPPIVVPPPNPTGGLTIIDGKLTLGGKPYQARGGNFSGLEFVAAQGWSPSDPWGGTAPDWTEYMANKPNSVRFPVNAASILGVTCFLTTGPQGEPVWGASRSADPGNNYRATLFKAVAGAFAAGCTSVFIDLHWTVNKLTLGGVTNYLMPLGQAPFMDTDMGQLAHEWLLSVFGTQATPQPGIDNSRVIIEGYNEPFLDSFGGTLSAGSPDLALLNGGTSTRVINYTQNGTNYEIDQTHSLFGYQALVDMARTMKADNIIGINGNSWAQQLQNYKTWLPKDPAGQLLLCCHVYPWGTYPYPNGTTYPKIGADEGAGTPMAYQWYTKAIADGNALAFTEDGGRFGPTATAGEPHMASMQAFADENGVSYLYWQENNYQSPSANGSNYATITGPAPSNGQGTQTKGWMRNHAA